MSGMIELTAYSGKFLGPIAKVLGWIMSGKSSSYRFTDPPGTVPRRCGKIPSLLRFSRSQQTSTPDRRRKFRFQGHQ